ncbi:hypothetical protein BWI17_13165 [Betaproteobacteria bacterium GR16-43]|nr:hypothetical protein BWI17_13165 [Betaproteobacteria bacterium GR16-43]
MSFIHSLRIRFGSLVLLATLALSLPASAVISTVANGFNSPIGIVADGSGNLYVADTLNQRVVKVSPSGVITLVAGNGTPAFGGDGGPATAASLNQPEGVAVDGAGNVYIADSSNRRVRRVDAADGTISTVAGTGVPGNEGDGGPATSANMSRPVALAFDAAGDLYIADQSRGRVRRISAGIITTFAGTTLGFSGDGGPASAAQLRAPSGLAFDPAGNLYIVDYFNFRIRQVTPAGIISTVAGIGAFGIPEPGTPATQSPMEPSGVAYAGGALYLADDQGFVLRVKDGAVGRVAGGGSGGDGSLPTQASLGGPVAVAVGPDGALYILDQAGTGVGSIRKVSPIPTPPAAPAITGFMPSIGSALVEFNRLVDWEGPPAISPSVDGGAPIELVRITCTGGSGPVTQLADPISPAFIYALEPGVPYMCTLEARNAVGYSATSSFGPVVPSAFPMLRRDFNADNLGDLVWRHADGRTAVWLLFGTGILETSEIFPAGTAWQVAHIADLNGDYKSDLVWQHPDGRVTVYLMDGVTPTTKQLILPAGAWTVTQAADLNGDGKADLIFQNADGTVAAWLMNGVAMTSGGTLLSAGTGWSVTKTGDFDGDGKADLVWTHADGRVAIWLMDGLTVKSTNQILNAGSGWSVTHVADFNGDGLADLLWQNVDGSVAIWLMNGAAMASGAGVLGAGSGWTVTHTGDFDADGKADLLFTHADGRVAIYVMNGATPTETTQILNAGTGWKVKRVQYMDGDSRSDLVWEHLDGRAAVWIMNGTAMSSGGEIIAPGTGWVVSGVSP